MIVRALRTQEEYLAAEGLQRTVWHFPDREVIPLNELIVAQKHGGYVFGAFNRGRMVAFCFGVPAFRAGKVYHYSRMLGVLPAYQDTGLGRRMKLEQRRFVLKQGLDLIRWTFDPLQSRNAFFNLEKLGVLIREYEVNIYGSSGSRFNRGLETDRFVTEWWIRSRRVAHRISGKPSRHTLSKYAVLLGAENGIPKRWPVPPKGLPVAVENPWDINRLKEENLLLAKRWRREQRIALLLTFRRGYSVTGYITKGHRCFYLLERG